MKKHLIAIISILILLPLILSGCNAGDSKESASSSSESVSSSDPSSDAPGESDTPNDFESSDNAIDENSSSDTTADSDSVSDNQAESDTRDSDGTTTESTPESESDPLPPSVDEGKTIKILAIGNSFSVDAMEYLWHIFKDAGYDRVELGNLYIGGCSLDTHWSKIQSGRASYTYYENTYGNWKSSTSSANAAIKAKDWDIITVQQSSDFSGVASSYSNLNNILRYIENNTPEKTKILWHMTWAYQSNSTHSAFPTYDKNQMTMYNAIVSAVSSEILTNSQISGVIPSGTTVQNLRTSYFGDTLTRDGYHMSYSYGRYATALTWFAYISEMSVEDIDWVPSN